MEDQVGNITRLLKVLVSPVKGKFNSDVSTSVTIDEQLSVNLQILGDFLRNEQSLGWLRSKLLETELQSPSTAAKSTRWLYVETCLKLLVCLKDVLSPNNVSAAEAGSKGETHSAQMLSLQQEKVVTSTLQFVTVLGVISNLLPGVGLPLKKRSGFGNLVQLNTEVTASIQQYCRIRTCVCALLQCVEDQYLASIILPHFFGDILAALCQLSYSPIKYVVNTDETCSLEMSLNAVHLDDNNVEQSDVTAWLATQKQHFRKELDSLLDRIYQPMAVRELLLLQGNTSSPSSINNGSDTEPAPPWLRKVCSQLLSTRLIKPNGVQAVIRGILGVGSAQAFGVGGEENAADWRKCDVVARIIATFPPRSKSSDEYYSVICPQVLQLLEIRDSQTRKQFLRVACTSIALICDQNPEATKKYMMNVLLQPLLLCSLTDEAQDVTSNTMFLEEEKIVSEDDLSHCIEILELVFVTGCDPSPQMLGNLTPVIGILFHLYSFSKSMVSHIKGKLQTLLVAYVCHCSEASGTSVLRNFLFPDNFTETVVQWNRELHVCQGSNGGINVVYKPNSNDEFRWIEEDKMSALSVVELLRALRKDDSACAFFLALLEDLTEAIGTTDDQPSVPASSRYFLMSIEEKTEKRLNSIRKSLVLVEVLAALSEDPALQELVLHDKGSAARFIQTTLDRGAELCRLKSTAFMEVETLSTAMSFVVLLLSETLSLEMKSCVKQFVPALKVLAAEHTDEHVRLMAHELHVIIVTDNAVASDEQQTPPTPKDKRKSNFQEAW